MLEESLRIREHIDGNNTISLTKDYNVLAFQYNLSKNYERAEEIAEKSMTMIKNQRGENHFDLWNPYRCLGYTYKCTNRLNESEKIFKKCLELLEKEYGLEDERTKKVRNELDSVTKLLTT